MNKYEYDYDQMKADGLVKIPKKPVNAVSEENVRMFNLLNGKITNTRHKTIEAVERLEGLHTQKKTEGRTFWLGQIVEAHDTLFSLQEQLRELMIRINDSK